MRPEALFEGGRVVIIGGGVIGASIAYHLAAGGCSDVVVVERGRLAEATTAKATGGIRQQFSSRVNAQISREAVQYFEQFEEIVGEAFTFRQHGYLLVTRSVDLLAVAASAARMQRGLGIPTDIVSARDIADMHPTMRTSNLVGGTYCATDGSGSPVDLAQAYARQARRHGAVIRQHTEVVGIARSAGSRNWQVITAQDVLEAEVVINAAGPWARAVAGMVGIDVPVQATLRQAYAVAPMPWMSPGLPLTVELDSGAYLHPTVSGAVLGGTDRDRTPGFDQTVDEESNERLMEAVALRFPKAAEAQVIASWTGFREMTPDDHAIVGPVRDLAGFWLAIGFSGHGFMHSPIVGRELSTWILVGSPEIDLSDLDPMRFAYGGVSQERILF